MSGIDFNKILDLGFYVAEESFKYFRECKDREFELEKERISKNKELEININNKIENSKNEVIDAIGNSTRTLKIIIEDAKLSIFEKIELENLERLLSKIKKAKLSIEMSDIESYRYIANDLFDFTDYAMNRINEGKYNWVGPWMAGESIRLTLLSASSVDMNTKKVIERQYSEYRLSILNIFAPMMIKENKTPWLEISSFIEGRNEDIIEVFRNTIIPFSGEVSKENNLKYSCSVPAGRKICVSCRKASFDRVETCPNCNTSGHWWK